MLFIGGDTWIVAVPFRNLPLVCCSTCLRIGVLYDVELEEVVVPLGNRSLTKCIRTGGRSQTASHAEGTDPDAPWYVERVATAWAEQ